MYTLNMYSIYFRVDGDINRTGSSHADFVAMFKVLLLPWKSME
jgi:hypothetical protein